MTKFQIVQIGCGGTGGYLIPPLSKFISHLPPSVSAKYIIIDGDTVEERNVLRQNFLPEDIGKNKAAVLGERYGVETADMFVGEQTMPFILSTEKDVINIVIGCVDKVEARLGFIAAFEALIKDTPSQIVYVDAGNFVSTGQILVQGFCVDDSLIENVAEVINIKEIFKDSIGEDTAIPTCSELGDQSILANFTSALHLYNTVTTIMMTRKILTSEIKFTRHTFQTNTNLAVALVAGVI